ncbi:MAG: hypothetical protein QXY15_11255 [Candidatus Nitrosotenuis sp.]
MQDNILIFNGNLESFIASTEKLSDASHVQNIQLVLVDGTEKITLGKKENELHVSGDAGIMMLAVRNDVANALAPNSNYHPLTLDNQGRLWTNIGSMPAAARNTDSIATALMSDAIMILSSGTPVALTPKYISTTVAPSSNDQVLVSSVAGKKIRMLSLSISCGSTATDVLLESSTTDRKHKVKLGANNIQTLAFTPIGWFETNVGESLTCTTSAGSDVEITGVYIEV